MVHLFTTNDRRWVWTSAQKWIFNFFAMTESGTEYYVQVGFLTALA